MAPSCLLLHGFTGTSQSMEPLARALRSRGYAVTNPTLPGHGTTPEDLERTDRGDWFEAASQALDEAGRGGGPVCVAGLSLGSLLALKLAARFPEKVAALALVSTPLWLPWAGRLTVPLFKYTPLGRIWRFVRKAPSMGINSPDGRRRHIAYDVMPSAGIVELASLASEVRSLLPHIKTPAVVIHARRDPTAPLRSVAYLQTHLSSPTVETLIVERSRHILTFDYDSDRVVDAVASFFLRHAPR